MITTLLSTKKQRVLNKLRLPLELLPPLLLLLALYLAGRLQQVVKFAKTIFRISFFSEILIVDGVDLVVVSVVGVGVLLLVGALGGRRAHSRSRGRVAVGGVRHARGKWRGKWRGEWRCRFFAGF